MSVKQHYFLYFISFLLLVACTNSTNKNEISNRFSATLEINDETLEKADNNHDDWLTHGRNYSEDRYSPLNQINKSNIQELGLIWSTEIGTKRGVEATPIVVDGVMYISGPWNVVFAIDARNGNILWEFDPLVPRSIGGKVCCDTVNRGVAVYKGLVFMGTLDGRLIAINAATGIKEWEVSTIDQSQSYTITGAVRVVKGKVLVGNSGAEYGVRGYVSAYDAMTGMMIWRFYTVPGNPEEGFESEAMEKAAKTWNGEWWKYGGGGTVWDGMAYDPEANLVYIGTGNGSPWNREIRSPGGGDNLYLSSILALDPDTGKLIWYYQTTPGDSWDYTATQPIILADITINDEVRKVLMQAPKNGFFYVLDRITGEFISGEPFVYTNWATHIDYETGRPVESSFSRYVDENVIIAPGPIGAHNWHPMAYNRSNGLVYIPARESNGRFGPIREFNYNDNGNMWNVGQNGWDPSFPSNFDPNASEYYGKLIAYDPVKQEEKWHVRQNTNFNGGVFTTDELVFQGNAEGDFVAFDANTGEKIWSYNLESGILAPPITYRIDGIQYITVAVGWGGAGGLMGSIHTKNNNPGTVYTFAIGGNEALPDFPPSPKKILIDLPYEDTPEDLAKGQQLFNRTCSRCHGSGILPNLKYSTPEIYDLFEQIVGKGLFLDKGMPNFSRDLSPEDIRNIKNYLLSSAHIKTMDIIGDAIKGWNDPIPLTPIDGKENMWEGEILASDGFVKFRANNNWSLNWGGSALNNGELIDNGQNIKLEKGSYKVVLDLNEMSYQFTKI